MDQAQDQQGGGVSAKEQGRKADGFLRKVAFMAEDGSLGFPLTLSVGGLLISGITVSASEFFDHNLARLGEAFGVELPLRAIADIAETEATTAEADRTITGAELILFMVQNERDLSTASEVKRREILASVDNTEDGPPQELADYQPQYIHLRDATIFHPAQTKPIQGQPIWWRSPLTAVDGFFIGQVETQSSARA